MEIQNEEIDVRFVDGSEGKVKVKKYVSLPAKQKLIGKYSSKGKLVGQNVQLEMDFFALIPAYLELVWADDEHKIDDVSSESIEPYVMDKIQNFLYTGAGKNSSK